MLLKKIRTISLAVLLFLSVALHTLASPYEVVVRLDPNRLRSIRLGEYSVMELERDRYFRTYLPLGNESDAMTAMLQELRATPGRGTTVITGLRQDPQRPGYVDPASLQANMGKFVGWYQRAQEHWPGIVHAMAHATSPPWLQGFATEGKHQEEAAYLIQADVIRMWYDNLKQAGVSYPLWYSSWNEPHHTFGGQQLGVYTRILAETMAEYHPDILIAGPTSAYPQPQRANWARWYNQEKAFIDEAGGAIAAYDFHLYARGDWSHDFLAQRASSPSFFDSQREFVGSVWQYGRMESFLDLVAAYHMYRWREPAKPVIISEFGRPNIHPQHSPYWENEFKPWLHMITVTNLWMRLMERPEVQLAVPFIVPERRRSMAIVNSEGPTRFKDFYAFFRDLQGLRITADVLDRTVTESRYMLVQPFLNGDEILVLLHNQKGFPRGGDANVTIALPPEIEIVHSEIKRLRWEGQVPEPHDDPHPEGVLRIDTEYGSLPRLVSIPMQGEETCIVKITLAKPVEPSTIVAETWHYSLDVLLDIQGDRWHDLDVEVERRVDEVTFATLGLGLYRDGGFGVNPQIRVNDQLIAAPFDITYSQGIVEFQSVETILFPPELLLDGKNTVSVWFPAEVAGGDPRIVTAKIIVGYCVLADFPFYSSTLTQEVR